MTRPLLLVHGQTFDQTYWSASTPLIASPTEALDLPSHGEAEDLRPGDYDAFGRAVADAVQANPAPEVCLLGHSLGALAVVEALILLNHRGTLDQVDRVMLLGTVGEPDDEAAALQRGFADLVAEHGLADPILSGLIARWFDASWLARHDGLAIVRELQAQSTPSRIEAVCRILAERPTLCDRLPAELPPITLVQLTRDQSTPPESAASVRDALKPAQVIDIEGPHLWPTQDPEAFAELVNVWLR
ncbi:MAG: alpha/beta hydrolase [Deltaproteobacteria bacterium]|nr:MAG: alpha/beta hydrolase [Deltaproteobacteria bacterium]